MKAAAFFDMDGTLLCGESQLSFLLWCWWQHLAPPVRSLWVVGRYAEYVLGVSRDGLGLRESGFALMKGLSSERLEKAAAAFCAGRLGRGLRRQAVPLVEAHRQRGHVTVLVTSACEAVAGPVAEKLGVDALVATRLAAKDGVCTGERVLPEPYGPGKRLLVERFCAEHGVSPKESFAYSDHHSDAPLLEAIGHPVAVNPTRKLRGIAAARGWGVLDLDAAELPDLALPETRFQC